MLLGKKKNRLTKDDGQIVGSFRGVRKIGFLTVRGFVVLSIVLLASLVGGLYYYRQSSGMNGYKKLAKQSDDIGVAISTEKTSKPLDPNATPSQKAEYYSAALWLKVREGNDDATAQYYIDNVKPQKVELALDMSERLVQILVTTKHHSEAKELVRYIIDTYKNAPVPNEPAAKEYLASKIKQYTEMEKTL